MTKTKEKLLVFSLSKGRIAMGLVLAALSLAAGLALDSGVKFVLVICAAFVLGAVLKLEIKGKYSWLLMLAAAFAASVATVFLVQLANDDGAMLPVKKLVLNVELALLAIILVHFVISLIWRAKNSAVEKTAIMLTCILLLVFATTNYYVLQARGKALSPADIYALSAAAEVVDGYSFEIMPRTPKTIMLMMAAVFLLSGIRTAPIPRKLPNRILQLMLMCLMCLQLHASLEGIKPSYWANAGCTSNGLILNFSAQIRQSSVTEPEGYSTQEVTKKEEQYQTLKAAGENTVPDIIVIMNESFADLGIYGSFESNVPLTPFWDSLEENTIRGYALASIFGANTAVSEYEFLTGNSMGFLSPGIMPFQQYLKDGAYSVRSYLESAGYSSFFTHPARSGNWGRDTAYENLHFEEFAYLDAYDGCELVHNYVSDRAMYNKLIAELEADEDARPQFLYAVTIQNHGPYNVAEPNFDRPVWLEGVDAPEINDYLSCINTSDAAFRELIEHFEAVDEPVVILMYGDHQPKVAPEFREAIGYVADGSFEVDMSQYIVPFVIWANYDIEEKDVELTSINFLSNYLLEAAELPMSPYNSFLCDVQEVIPAMNAYGYWSKAEGCFKNFDEAQGLEKEMLTAYEMLQYNSMFDKKGRSEVFFPMN